MREKYETDLTDEQWEVIAPLFSNMRKYKWEKRELVNAVLYLVKTGCQWRNLPHDFPPVFTVHSFYRRRYWMSFVGRDPQSEFTRYENGLLGNGFGDFHLSDVEENMWRWRLSRLLRLRGA